MSNYSEKQRANKKRYYLLHKVQRRKYLLRNKDKIRLQSIERRRRYFLEAKRVGFVQGQIAELERLKDWVSKLTASELRLFNEMDLLREVEGRLKELKGLE